MQVLTCVRLRIDESEPGFYSSPKGQKGGKGTLITGLVLLLSGTVWDILTLKSVEWLGGAGVNNTPEGEEGGCTRHAQAVVCHPVPDLDMGMGYAWRQVLPPLKSVLSMCTACRKLYY